MKITLSLPPTDNHSYLQRGKIRFMTKQAKDWKEETALIVRHTRIRISGKSELIEGDVNIGEIHFYLKFPRDIQGSLKLLFDAMERIVYENDKQIVRFGPVFKHLNNKELNPRLELTL